MAFRGARRGIAQMFGNRMLALSYDSAASPNEAILTTFKNLGNLK